MKFFEKYFNNHLKIFFLMMAGLLVIGFIAAASTFFVMVRGGEQTLVPDLRGKDLIEALMELQVKELYPRIQLRFSQSAHDRGLVLDQDPHAGAIVKAGRRIRLVVSQGVIINRVENYIGRNVEEVRMDLQALGTAAGILLNLQEPFLFDFSNETPGTILRQNPESGTEISGPVNLEFVVSRGPENTFVTVPQFVGTNFESALEELGKSGVAFIFNLRETYETGAGGIIVLQNPQAGTSITTDTVITLTVNIPNDLNPGEIFGMMDYTMPRNPYPLPLSLETLLPTGERVHLIETQSLGGRFTVPYRLPADSVLILTLMNREIYREKIWY